MRGTRCRAGVLALASAALLVPLAVPRTSFARASSALGTTEFQVNVYTTDRQTHPAVAAASDGTFVVVWTTEVESRPYYGYTQADRISARAFASTGASSEPEVVLVDEDSSTAYPDIAFGAGDASFAVAWGEGSDTTSVTRFFDVTGTPVGPDARVSSWEATPTVRPTEAGFVVVSERRHSCFMAYYCWTRIQAQHRDADAQPLGPPFGPAPPSDDTSNQLDPALAIRRDGSVVLAWTALDDGAPPAVRAQVFSSAGDALTPGLDVGEGDASGEHAALAVAQDGGFLVVWERTGAAGDPAGRSIGGRRYGAGGAARTSPFQVNAYTTRDQRRPRVATTSDGHYAVVWDSEGSRGDDDFFRSVQMRAVLASGALGPAELQLNAITTQAQSLPALAALPGGEVAVVWQSDASAETDSHHSSIQVRLAGPFVVFADGFESRGVARWPGAVEAGR